MRVGHCVHGLGIGGAQKVIGAIVAGSSQSPGRADGTERAEGIQHFLYTPEDGALRPELEAAGATIRLLPRLLPKLDPLWVLRLRTAFRRDGLDVIHSHLFGDTLHGFLAARSLGLPVLITLHTVASGLSGLQRRGYRSLLHRCETGIACSETVARSFIDYDPTLGDRLQVIPNGIDEAAATLPKDAVRREVRQELGLDEDAVVLASIGRLAAEKALDLFVDAFAAMSGDFSSCRLLFVGDGPERRRLEDRVRSQGLQERVIFVGFRSDVLRLLAGIDVVVFSSSFEGLSVALLEAMAQGKCLVTTDAPGILEAVEPEKQAIVAPRGEVLPFARALERAAASKALRQELGVSARQRFLERYSASQMVASYERVYDRLAPASHDR